jgi:hypothetical protein
MSGLNAISTGIVGPRVTNMFLPSTIRGAPVIRRSHQARLIC